MKTLIAIMTISMMILPIANAQMGHEMEDEYQSIFSPNSMRTGWFVDINQSYTRLNGMDAWMPGFAAGVVMNRETYIGLKVSSFSWYEKSLYYTHILPEECYLAGGFAGLFMESGLKSNNLLHVSFPLTIGGGGAAYISKNEYPELDEGEIDFSHKELSVSPFFVLEPGVNIELNITGFMKFYAGYSYRWLGGLSLENTNRNALNGSNLNIGVKLGKF